MRLKWQYYWLIFRYIYTVANARSQLKSIRSLQLHLTLINIANHHVIFAFKLLAIGVCVTNGYAAAVAHVQEYLVFGLMYSVLFVDLAVSYIIVYEKAFAVPKLFDEAVTQICHRLALRRVRSICYCMEERVLERQFRAVRRVGVKIGDFHTLERTSSPIFVDFVLKNVVNMLVIF